MKKEKERKEKVAEPSDKYSLRDAQTVERGQKHDKTASSQTRPRSWVGQPLTYIGVFVRVATESELEENDWWRKKVLRSERHRITCSDGLSAKVHLARKKRRTGVRRSIFFVRPHVHVRLHVHEKNKQVASA